jgi:hypothetical protein
MIIGYLDVQGIAIFPRETNPELIIDSDAELPLAFCLQSLQAVAGRSSQVVQSSGRVQQKKLSQGWPNQARRELSGFSCQPQQVRP